MYDSVTFCQIQCSMTWSEMIIQAMPRIKNEMPYGRIVLLGEEHVTTQSSLSNIGTTLFINLLAATCFWTGWRWILYSARGRSGGRIQQKTIHAMTDHTAKGNVIV